MKSNILLIGPTGTGKTLLCETLARILDVPFVTADATTLAQSEYVGEEIEAILQRLIDPPAATSTKAQRGVVFIDEVDKLKATNAQMRGPSGEQVCALKIMEGSAVKLSSGAYLDTNRCCSSAVAPSSGSTRSWGRNHSFGFISTSEADSQKILDRLNARVNPTDLNEFGLIPEFAGRLPVVAQLNARPATCWCASWSSRRTRSTASSARCSG